MEARTKKLILYTTTSKTYVRISKRNYLLLAVDESMSLCERGQKKRV